MASFNYTVDTNPMANEIGSVSNHIAGTTTAVVAMKVAVIAAEERAADHVCNNVNRGFFTLMRSQISQKMAKEQSNVDSFFMQLSQQRKQLLAIKGRMERDYGMISARYLKLFNALNANLKQRIYELDKPTMDFAMRDMEKSSNRTKYLTATVPLSQAESLAISQKIIASNVKYRGLKVIASMTQFLSGVNEQKRLTDRILLSGSAANANLSVPVIISESIFDKLDNRTSKILVGGVVLDHSRQSAVKNRVAAAVENLRWESGKETERKVAGEFSKLLAACGATQRVKDMAARLFAAGNFQVLKNAAL